MKRIFSLFSVAAISILLLSPISAQAQLPNILGATSATTIQTQLAAVINKINGFVQQFTTADLTAAIADANAQTSPDATAAACWKDIQSLTIPTVPTGAGVAYAVQRARDIAALQGPINTDCAKVVPQFVGLFNQGMALLAQVGG